MSDWVGTVVLVAGTACGYGALVWLANVYSRRTGWQPPAGTASTDWTLRRNLGIGLGALAVCAGALACSLWEQDWPGRLLIAAQAAVLAAAGASDLRRFHLPLPLTLAGVALAVATALVTRPPVMLMLTGLIWALVVVLLHGLLSKGSMQLGDHLATVWIALAAPLNGMLAVAAGDFANAVLARVKSLKGRKVAAAGAWLIWAAVFVGLPPYVVWFAQRPQAGGPPPVAARVQELGEESPTSTGSWPPAYSAAPARPMTRTIDAGFDTLTNTVTSSEINTVTNTVLIRLAEWAGDYTAEVAFADQRADRIWAARQAAENVRRLAELAQQIAPGSGVAGDLYDLASALSDYDLAGVRDASQRLADERERFSFRFAPGLERELEAKAAEQ
jgi:hypothetical protein